MITEGELFIAPEELFGEVVPEDRLNKAENDAGKNIGEPRPSKIAEQSRNQGITTALLAVIGAICVISLAVLFTAKKISRRLIEV